MKVFRFTVYWGYHGFMALTTEIFISENVWLIPENGGPGGFKLEGPVTIKMVLEVPDDHPDAGVHMIVE